MSDFFSNPRYLWALAGAALPLLIHLLTRDRVRKVQFSTLRFFANSARMTLARKRFQEALLILLRMAVCALLALVFAGPLGSLFGARGVLSLGEVARVVVVDTSGSMNREGVRQALRQELDQVADQVGPQGDTAVVAFDTAARTLCEFGQPADAVREALHSIAPGHGGTDFAAGLRSAEELLAGVEARNKQIVFISDLQKSGWSGFLGDWRLSPDVRLEVRPLKPAPDQGNVAIVQANLPEGVVKDDRPQAITVGVRNFGATMLERVPVVMEIDGKVVESAKVSLPPGTVTPVRLRHVFSHEGDNFGQVRVDLSDADPVDSVFYFNVRVLPRIAVTILNGHPSAKHADDAAFFLRLALDLEGQSPLEVRTADAATASAGSIAAARVVVLADADTIAPQVVEALAGVLERGGGLLFIPGRHTDPAKFARSFAELAPAGLGRVLTPVGAAETETETTLSRVDLEHPVFEVFAPAHYGSFATVAFYKYWEVTGSQMARVPARFEDRRPALLERKIGKGISMMSLTPGDPEWSGFPRHVLFVPYLQELVKYLGTRTERKVTYQVGEPLLAARGATATDSAGQQLAETAKLTATPGIYTIAGNDSGQQGGGDAYRVAVNRDFAESDADTLPGAELVEALSGSEDGPSAASSGGAAGLAASKQLWVALLLSFCALSIVELTVGNSTRRH